MSSVVALILISAVNGLLACYSLECKDKYDYQIVLSTNYRVVDSHKVSLVEKQIFSGPEEIYEYPAYCVDEQCIGVESCDSDEYSCFISSGTPEIQIVVPKDIAKRKQWELSGVTFKRSNPKIDLTPKEPVYLVTWFRNDSEKNDPSVGYFLYAECSGVLAFSVAWDDRIEMMELSKEEKRGFGSKECVFLNE